MENKKGLLKSVLYKVYTNIWIKSIRRGLLIIQPLILISCLFGILTEIPSIEFKNFMNLIFGDSWIKTSRVIYDELYLMMKPLMIITINYSLANIRNSFNKEKINPIIVSMVGIFSVIILTDGFEYNITDIMNAKWSFISIIISIIFSELYIYLNMIRKKKKNKGIAENTHDRAVQQSISAFLPMLVIIMLLFLIKNLIISNLIELQLLIENLSKYKINIYTIDDIFSKIKYLLTSQLYWFLGAHGGDIVDVNIINKSYINVFCNIGGAGSTISLVIGILILNTNKYKKNISKISVIPSIFNINELVTYGLPVIFNPIYLIPFIITPIILMIITQIAFEIGFIQLQIENINYMAPIFYNGYKVTRSLNGVILQIINIIIGVFIYIPFIKIADQMNREEEDIAYSDFREEIFKNNIERAMFNKREDNIGDISHSLSIELTQNLLENKPLYLEYQPQVNKLGHVVGVEALLRWKHKDLGNIPPNMTIILAEEIGIIDNLGNWIIEESCSQLSKWNMELDKYIDMSINISTIQLKNNLFTDNLKDIIKKYDLNPDNIKIEITESLSLGNDETTKNQLNKLSELGVKLAIDDFGAGYNSISYIKKYNINTLKIDGSLIRDIETNDNSRRIVKAMYDLCKTSNIEIVNEFIETKEQKEILDKMGDGLYQGYLFSKPLGPDECIKYIKNNLYTGA